MMLKLSEILPTLLLWMMGNSSSLHSAIIYIDLSLFRFSAFWTCCFSSLGYESSTEVQPHNSRNRVMLKIFLGSRRYILPCGIWVFSRSSKGRKEGGKDRLGYLEMLLLYLKQKIRISETFCRAKFKYWSWSWVGEFKESEGFYFYFFIILTGAIELPFRCLWRSVWGESTVRSFFCLFLP